MFVPRRLKMSSLVLIVRPVSLDTVGITVLLSVITEQSLTFRT